MEAVTPLLNEFRWGHIFFTGGTNIGKIVMTAAAKRLVPVTLELGGKSPCIVTASADIPLAARRIAWGKWASNAGQVCVAPDHVLVHASVAEALIGELEKCVHQFFPSQPKADPNFARIISTGHARRLEQILQTDHIHLHPLTPDSPSIGDKFIPPSLLDFGEDWQAFAASASMAGEIFGPILPVVRFAKIHTLQDYLSSLENSPLALYVFSRDSAAAVRSLSDLLPSGAIVVNDCGIHIVESALPFGGVGASGMGQYHGKRTFDLFTHYRPTLWKSGWMDIPMRYPPAGVWSTRVVGFLLWLARKRVTPIRIGKWLLVLGLVYRILRRP